MKVPGLCHCCRCCCSHHLHYLYSITAPLLLPPPLITATVSSLLPSQAIQGRQHLKASLDHEKAALAELAQGVQLTLQPQAPYYLVPRWTHLVHSSPPLHHTLFDFPNYAS